MTSNNPTPSNKDDVKDILHEAAIKAMEATNLCEKHMKYHGQKTPECTPIERQMVELTTPSNKRIFCEACDCELLPDGTVVNTSFSVHCGDGNHIFPNPTPSNDELFQLTHSFAIGDQCMECEEELNKELLNWANKKVIEGRVEQVMQDEQSFTLEFSPPVDESKIIEWRTQTIEALRKKG